MNKVYVTNTSESILTDSWDGIAYTLKPNETIEVPIEFATHVLGYQKEHKEQTLARLGWIKFTNELEEGLKKLQKFVISDTPKIKNHSLPPVVERVPLPSTKKAGGNVPA